MRKIQIGMALDSLEQDVRDQIYILARQAQDGIWPPMLAEQYRASLLRQAVDSPARARAQLQHWINEYNATRGAQAAQTLFAEALTLAGSSKTLASINAALQALANQAATIVTNVSSNGWTWDQVAAAIDAQFAPEAFEEFSYLRLPVPSGYVTVWGDPW